MNESGHAPVIGLSLEMQHIAFAQQLHANGLANELLRDEVLEAQPQMGGVQAGVASCYGAVAGYAHTVNSQKHVAALQHVT